MIIQRFNLNLIPNQSPVIVHVNQYDTGTGRLVATLYEGNEPYSPSGTAVIQGTKPDGHGFQYTATLDGNVVTADLTEQMAPVAGDVRTQIVVTEPSGETGTFVFIMRVQPSALPSDTDMSESDYPLIEEAIREAQEAVQTAQEAVERAQEAITETQENAENSEAWAQGTRGGIPVGPTDPTYEHNAKYWAQYAERYAQGGLHYKASILFANIPTTGMREGDMYDITDDFTTDSRFTEGAGIKVKGGTNIAWNSDNKWDILALPYIPKTTFNGRSGSILPMAGDYDSEKILLSSILHIGGETQNDVQEALEALEGNNQAIQNQLNDKGVLGAKNLLEVTANTQTINGVTFTVNRDSNGNALNVNVNGTPSSDIYFRINSKFSEVGRYILNGILGGSNTFRMQAYIYASSDDTFKRSYTDIGSGAEVVIDDGEYANFEIIVTQSGGAVNNKKVYPMIRLASDPDDTYVPHAMTNRELTDAVQGITVKSFTTEQFTVNAGQYSPQEISITNGDLIPLGIVGYRIDGDGNTECGMWKNWMDISTKKVLFGIKNFSASETKTVTVTIFVLYKG